MKRKKCSATVLPAVVMFIAFWLFFVVFNIASPYRCSMDFRYIVPVLFSTSIILGVTGSISEKSGGVISKTVSAVTDSLVILLAISSALAFI